MESTSLALECSRKVLSENETFESSHKDEKETTEANIQGPRISDEWKSKNKASDMFEENRKGSEVQEHSAGTGGTR